jgi:hypothetical protein
MIRDQFIKYKFKAYMQIDYKSPRMEEPIRCMLIAIDFDNEVMTLTPIDYDYENDNFNTTILYCFLPKMRVIKNNQ